MNARRRGVLFDLDGTLVDSVPDLAAAVNEALGQFGRPILPEAEIRQYVGDGARLLLARALSRRADADAATPEVDRVWSAFMSSYEAHLCVHSRLYPGVAETLSHLHAAGAGMGVVTNKPARFIAPLLERLGIRDPFGALVGGDSLPQRKPDPAPVHEAMRRLGLQAGKGTYLVGDSINDVRAGRSAGCVVVGVSYGYNHGVDLRQAGAAAVIDRMSDLTACLERLDGWNGANDGTV